MIGMRVILCCWFHYWRNHCLLVLLNLQISEWQSSKIVTYQAFCFNIKVHNVALRESITTTIQHITLLAFFCKSESFELSVHYWLSFLLKVCIWRSDLAKMHFKTIMFERYYRKQKGSDILPFLCIYVQDILQCFKDLIAKNWESAGWLRSNNPIPPFPTT